MTLVFSKPQGYDFYEASATVGSDWNLHMECEKPTAVTVDMSTLQTGKKKTVFITRESEVIDQDFDAIVYPKYVTVRSWVLPTIAVITEAE